MSICVYNTHDIYIYICMYVCVCVYICIHIYNSYVRICVNVGELREFNAQYIIYIYI